jgi:hypothetical protein
MSCAWESKGHTVKRTAKQSPQGAIANSKVPLLPRLRATRPSPPFLKATPPLVNTAFTISTHCHERCALCTHLPLSF